NYDLWVYLRHLGFPSPLLDWSESPYVAQFFAFETQRKVDRVAVYVFIERVGTTKGGIVGEARIDLQGPYTRSHRRHYQQQAWYTIATEFYNKKAHCFLPHNKVFENEEEPNQDILYKITLPMKDRLDALKKLYEYNITSFSLFGSEDALVNMLAF